MSTDINGPQLLVDLPHSNRHNMQMPLSVNSCQPAKPALAGQVIKLGIRKGAHAAPPPRRLLHLSTCRRPNHSGDNSGDADLSHRVSFSPLQLELGNDSDCRQLANGPDAGATFYEAGNELAPSEEIASRIRLQLRDRSRPRRLVHVPRSHIGRFGSVRSRGFGGTRRASRISCHPDPKPATRAPVITCPARPWNRVEGCRQDSLSASTSQTSAIEIPNAMDTTIQSCLGSESSLSKPGTRFTGFGNYGCE
jgi:hypothetical protein